jgi:hypothetical protein
MAVFWVVAPWSLVKVYRRFRGAPLNYTSDYTAQQPRRQPSSYLFTVWNFFVPEKSFPDVRHELVTKRWSGWIRVFILFAERLRSQNAMFVLPCSFIWPVYLLSLDAITSFFYNTVFNSFLPYFTKSFLSITSQPSLLPHSQTCSQLLLLYI